VCDLFILAIGMCQAASLGQKTELRFGAENLLIPEANAYVAHSNVDGLAPSWPTVSRQ
jgi:hypothetical protein